MVQNIGEPTFRLKQVKLELPPRYDGKPSIVNTWLFEVEYYSAIVGVSSPTDVVKLAVSRLERDAHTMVALA